MKTDPQATGGFQYLSQHSWYVKGCGVGATGRKRQLELEDEYWRLVLAGVGTVEACRQVGIGRKTGYRWQAERGGIPPPVWRRTLDRLASCRCWSGSV